MPSLISAVFRPRRGQSALFDALNYLSSPESGWDHSIVDLGEEDHGNWRRYGEHELYTLFHYKQHEPTDGRAERAWWADYYKMNRLYAERIARIYKQGDCIWVHDYHLCLLPGILRQMIPGATIGFFLHIPFPSSELLRCLSRRKEVLEGMLGASLIGFQSFGYSRHFVSCCKRILGFESSPAGVDAYGARVAVDVFPIGIDALKTEEAAFKDAAVDEKIKGIRELYAGKKIIVGRDRLDTVRGVAQKLQAFEVFLEKYPEWRDKVVLIQVTSPTSISEDEQEDAGHKLANQISALVSRINGLYGSLSFSPVRHYPQYISKEEYLALLRVADVGLITSTRDGMSTTSLEYVVCQRDNMGPLILSEFSGTAGNLANAMHINPWDFQGVAKTLNGALTMQMEDRKEQHDLLHNRVFSNTVQNWTNEFLNRLQSAVQSAGQTENTPVLDRALLLHRYTKAKKRLFMFDYDGTLTPIVRDPASAIPSDRVIRTLKTLAADARNSVWIISGRDQAFLDEWMGHIPELGLSAEHGSFLRHPHSEEWENMTSKTDMSWQSHVIDIFNEYCEKAQGSWIERKKVALTWHYRRVDPELGRYRAEECEKEITEKVVSKYDVEVMKGKANLEVRPRFVNKGEIAKKLVQEDAEAPVQSPSGDGGGVTPVDYIDTKGRNFGGNAAGAGTQPDFVLCLGDDFTDEDMFRALHASSLPKDVVFTCTVGASSKQTLATYHLLEPADVISTVAMLNGSIDDGSVGPMVVATEGMDARL